MPRVINAERSATATSGELSIKHRRSMPEADDGPDFAARLPGAGQAQPVPARHRPPPDGYHLLQSVFQLIDRGDTLISTCARRAHRAHNDVPGVPEEQDLIVRALRALQAEYQRRHGRCRPASTSHRKAPADGWRAGRRLVRRRHRADGANHLWQAGLTRRRADGARPAAGRRHSLLPVRRDRLRRRRGGGIAGGAGPDCWYVVIEPGVSVPTAAIFTAPDLTRDTKPITVADFPEGQNGSQDLIGFGKNDLQDVAVPPVPAGSRGDRMVGASRGGQDDWFRSVRVQRVFHRARSRAGSAAGTGEVDSVESKVANETSDEIALANQRVVE
jgi:hypothetical protein